MVKRYFLLNPNGSADETDPNTQIIQGISATETAQQAAARKSADNAGVQPLAFIPGPPGMNLFVDSNLTAKTMVFKGTFPAGTTLRVSTVSGNSFLLGNSTNNGLASDTDYPFETINTVIDGEAINAQWSFGPRAGTSGTGIPNERLSVVIKDSAGKRIVTVEFNPGNNVNKQLFKKNGVAPTPTQTATPTTSPTQTTNPTPTTSPTACLRPSGLGTYTYYWNYALTGGSAKLFSSLAEACQYGSQIKNDPSTGVLATASLQAGSLSVNQQLFDGVGTNCYTVGTGFYYVYDGSKYYAIKVNSNSRIEEVIACTSAAQSSNIGLTARMSYANSNNGFLRVRGIGQIDTSYTMKIESLGAALSLYNPDSPTVGSIPTGQFLGWGPSGDNTEPMDWTLYGVTPGVPLRLTFQRNGTNDVVLTTPAVGNNQALLRVGANPTPTTSPTQTSNPTTGGTAFAPQRAFVMGNSITHHPGVDGVWEHNWGMAADSKEQDYWHQYWDNLKTLNPNVQFKECQDLTGFITDGPYFEQAYWHLDGGFDRFNAIRDYIPDLALFRLGENAGDTSHDFVSYYKMLIRLVVSKNPTCVIILTNSCWPADDVNVCCKLVYDQLKVEGYNIYFVDLKNIAGSTSGVLSHPNQAAHNEIAARIWAQTPRTIGGSNPTPTQTSSTTSNSTGTGTGTGAAANTADYVAGAFDFTELPAIAVPSDYRATLESSSLRVTLDLKEGVKPNKGLAGGIRYLVDKSTGNNTLNVPVFQQGSGDDYGFPLGTVNDGRSINECLYRYPAPWNLNGKALGIGDNVNETGDVTETPSRLIAYGNNGSTLFTKIEPNQWDGEGLRTGDVFKKWIKVSGNEMRVWYESQFNRTSATGANERQESKVQEAPCNYMNGNYSTICFYDGDAPYTNAPHRTLRLDDNSGMTPGATFLTENWAAGMDPDTGRCQGMIFETPATQFGQFQTKGSYNAEGSLLSSTYIAYYPFQLLDYNIKWRHSVIFVVGTLAEIRQKAYLYTSWKRTLEVRFNQAGRQNWGGRWFDDGGYKETRSTWGPITWTSNEGEIVTPAVALDGSIKKMYMRYKYTSSSRSTVNMIARWTRARQAAGYSNGTALWNERFPEGAAVGNDYAKPFSLVADGQWHVKEIDFSDKDQWRQIITQVRFTNDGQQAVGESLEVEWFSGSSNGPATSGIITS